MPRHHETRKMPYSAEKIFALVADVAKYPEFLPWCAAARLRSQNETDGICVLDADLVISFMLFREKFGSRVTLDARSRRIEVDYLDGPFKYLKNNWVFRTDPMGCEVDFDVDFEFRSIILQNVIGVVFNDAMQQIVRAFEKRAEKLYGPGAQVEQS